MADVVFTTTRVALATDGNNQDITVSGIGTPTAAMFFVSKASANGTVAADATLSIGYTDGTNQRFVQAEIVDGGGSTSSARFAGDDGVFSLAAGSNGAFVSWITDGVRINSTTLPAGYLLTVVFITGAHVEDALVFDRGLQSSTSPQDFTGVGFAFDTLFLAHSYVPSFASLAHGALAFGCVINDNASTPTQKSIGWCADDGATTGDQNTIASDAYALVGPLIGLNRFNVTISDIDSTGYTHTSSGSTGTLSIGLALKFSAGVSMALVDSVIPTSGDYAQADVGFTPEFGMMAHVVGPSSYGSLDTGANSGAFSIAAFDDTNIYTTSVSDEDGADPIVAKSLSTDAFRLLDNDATDAVVASGYAFDSAGWDFTLTTNPAVSPRGWGFAFSSGGAAPDTTAPTLSSPTATQTGATTADLSVSTDEGNGTLSWVVTTSATAPSVAQVKAGQDHTGAAAADSGSQSVSATGVQNANATGLTAETTYYAHFQHVDAAANDSTVSTSASFTTAAAVLVVKGARVTLYSDTTEQASITGITAMWWDSSPPAGNPVFTTATASTDASGVLELDLDADTALDVTDPGHLMVYKLDGTEEMDSLAWQGRLLVQDIS